MFESLGDNQQAKTIYAYEPQKIFDSIEELDVFIKANPKLNGAIAGYISYEGAAEFAYYEKINILDQSLDEFFGAIDSTPIEVSLEEPEANKYINAIEKCQEYIGEGDIYQANLTRKFKLKTQAPNGLAFYKKLRLSNPSPYAGYMNFANYEICSSSPESFLKIAGSKISSSPIKGTADLSDLNFLKNSSKDKAEHIMIVDLERNDLGRICKSGSVNVEEMLALYKFKNLYHYISTITGDIQDKYLSPFNIKAIFDACFPGGSITGAPKIRAMEIIKELEACDRGPYTGSFGYLLFDQGKVSGEFNILIRSLVKNKKLNEWSFHSGGGITAYSIPKKELEESNLKAEKILSIFKNPPKSVEQIKELVETIKVDENGLFDLEPHLTRLKNSLRELSTGCALDEAELRDEAIDLIKTKNLGCLSKLRFIYNLEKQNYKLELMPYQNKKEPYRLKFLDPKRFSVDSKDKLLKHKFLPRYDFTEELKDHDEVCWVNEQGHVCEGSYTNVFFEKDGEWHTPALDCGLLAGTKRSDLIKELAAKEGYFKPEELKKADKIMLSNAIIGSKYAKIS